MTAARAMVDKGLSTFMHALQATISTILGGSTGALIRYCDMFLNVPLVTDWHLIAQQQEQLVNESILCQNKKAKNMTIKLVKNLEKTSGPNKVGAEN